MGDLLHDFHDAHVQRLHRLGSIPNSTRFQKPEPAAIETKVEPEIAAPIPVANIPPVVIPARTAFNLHATREPEPEPVRRPAIETIKRAVCAKYNLTVLDMESARRTANVVRPRQIAAYLARHLTLNSFPEIGRRLGGRDHTTALWACRKIAGLRATDALLNSDLTELEAALAPAT